MRLKRITLFALLSVMLASGCTASRHAASSLQNDVEPVTRPPRHDHEYSPSLTPESNDFRNPPGIDSPKEPVPAPPALGVSRVKSVSWLKDLGTKFNGSPGRSDSACSELSCSDEDLLGKCSAIDPCVPDSGCNSQNSRSPFESYSGSSCDSPKHLNALNRLRKSVARLVHKPKPVTSVTCGIKPCSPDACSGTTVYESRTGTTNQSAQKTPTQSRPVQAPAIPSQRSDENHKQLLTERRKECLAEPLIESFGRGNPGLIGPGIGRSSKETLAPAPIFEAPTDTYSDGIPTEPLLSAPFEIEHRAPDSQLVEPPLWPRLTPGGGLTSISSSASQAAASPSARPQMSLPQTDVSQPAVPAAVVMPQVIPMSRP